MSIIDKYSNLIHQVPVKSVKAPLLLPMESHRKLGITREEIEEAFLGLEWWEIALRRVPDGGILLCPQVDGFRGMPAARDSENSSGYGGAASAQDSADSSGYGGAASGYEGATDKGSAASGYGGAAVKGMTMVKITDLPEKRTSKHELHELFKTSGYGGAASARDSANSSGYGGAASARDSADSSSYGGAADKGTAASGYGGAASARDFADSSGYGGAADKGTAASGYGGAADKGIGDAPEGGQGWIRDTARPFWQKPIQDTLVRGQDLISHTSKSERKPIGDHQFQSNRKSNRNRSQFGYGRPYWKS